VAVLSEAIRTYLKKILQQSQELQEARRLTAEAHYETLEAQLNPHFLYNTLAVISMTGLENGNMKVFHMCNKLSALLRYSLSFSGKAVQISDEVENVENYLYIMNARLEGRLAVAWERNEK
jgi:two-component system sensor histidine kinase YesM